MVSVNWISRGPRSGETILSAPGTAPDAASIARLDAARAGFAGPVPGWFRPVERLGSWWYLVLALLACAVYLVVGAATGGISPVLIAVSLSAGLVIAVPARAAANSIAQSQSRKLGRSKGVPQTIAGLDAVVRVAATGAQEAVDTLLSRDPSLEPRVHELLWRRARTNSSDGDAAAAELRALLAEQPGAGNGPENGPGGSAGPDDELQKDTDEFLRRMKDKGTI